VCEPLARLGASVTGIDADAQAIGVAQDHADQAGLAIEYKACAAESLLHNFPPPVYGRGDQGGRDGVARKASSKKAVPPSPTLPPAGGREGEGKDGRFDVVLALEIVEHVAEPESFVRTCAQLCRPGGLVIFSTLNRTARSFALGIVAAEYVLGWVPRGTHDWKKFLQPAELGGHMRRGGLTPLDVTGMIYNPLKQNFALSRTDIAVNYFLTAEKSL
jgi:2-polyprenyl-6-hydroxyphenyl methylase/3-demethylubiquinone-9 3-methyltransferase